MELSLENVASNPDGGPKVEVIKMIIFGMNETEIKEELSRMSAIELRENADELDRTVIAYLDLTSAMRKRADKLDQEKLNYLAGL